MLPYIEIFGKQVPTYGICFFAGLCIAVLAAVLLSKKRNILSYDVIYAAVIAGVSGLVGSKLLFVIVSLPTIIEQNIPLINVFKGGFVFYGGLIGGVIGLYIYVKGYKLSKGDFFDLFATAVPLGHAIGRVGCFLGGCCYGIEYSGPLHCVYTVNIGNTPTNIPLLPVQLIEAFLLLCLFGLLVILYNKRLKKGTQVAVYALAYSVIRFVLEFFRGDKERGEFFGISTSQIISVLIVILISVYLISIYKKKDNKNNAVN